MAGESITVVVEIPKGSRNKYEYDERLGGIKLDRFLFSSMVYPTDYGYIPETLALDGDALDAMVCVSEATFPGCIIDVKPIALFKMADDKGIDDKILCVPVTDPAWSTLNTLEDLPDQLRDEIAHFFSVYKDLEQKKVTVDGWYSREDALAEIEEARGRYDKDGGDSH
jgi:inorganic pyrophosphatase